LKQADLSNTKLEGADFSYANCLETLFCFAQMPYANFSHANLSFADFSQANLLQSLLHRVVDEGTIWRGTNKKKVEYTDTDLVEAEDWLPPTIKSVKAV
jgi:uncharacterized protein YjbI with pentapeptide repeats